MHDRDWRMITLQPSSDHRCATYGITHESVTVHDVAGPGVHNRASAHRVEVWDNTVRPNVDPEWQMSDGKVGPGAYVGPDGRGTDDAITVYLTAQGSVISATPIDGPRRGEALAMGDTVRLRFPGGALSGPMVVTARRWADPILSPATAVESEES